MKKKAEKVTEGVGYLTGDLECFCISEMPLGELMELNYRDPEKGREVIGRRVYPRSFFPEGHQNRRVRYRIAVELEDVGE